MLEMGYISQLRHSANISCVSRPLTAQLSELSFIKLIFTNLPLISSRARAAEPGCVCVYSDTNTECRVAGTGHALIIIDCTADVISGQLFVLRLSMAMQGHSGHSTGSLGGITKC